MYKWLKSSNWLRSSKNRLEGPIAEKGKKTLIILVIDGKLYNE